MAKLGIERKTRLLLLVAITRLDYLLIGWAGAGLKMKLLLSMVSLLYEFAGLPHTGPTLRAHGYSAREYRPNRTALPLRNLSHAARCGVPLAAKRGNGRCCKLLTFYRGLSPGVSFAAQAELPCAAPLPRTANRPRGFSPVLPLSPMPHHP